MYVTNDTFFIWKRNIENRFTIKVGLRCFMVISRFKINFYKSKLGDIGLNKNQPQGFVAILNCLNMSILFTYSGISIGDNMRKVKMWTTMLHKIRKRLVGWGRI